VGAQHAAHPVVESRFRSQTYMKSTKSTFVGGESFRKAMFLKGPMGPATTKT
jgi:hypothetical protein